MLRALGAGQGAYFLATGVWPLVSLRTFERVTGPKVDDWLVRTVGVVVAAVGATLLVGARRRRPSPEQVTLAVGSALGLGAIDVVYAARGRISRIYLADAVVEAALVAAWL
ncbi:MAG TPA: hypothetical protein VNN07_11870, partial [Candidatus Tectomicrobia bacterium]|nr:hypothetical protein [Candidatus Tectomicrobia bacterium]